MSERNLSCVRGGHDFAIDSSRPTMSNWGYNNMLCRRCDWRGDDWDMAELQRERANGIPCAPDITLPLVVIAITMLVVLEALR